MPRRTPAPPEQKNVLIVGDWVLDEHWVTGIHRSPTSSRRGQAHHRALHILDSTTKSFCASGRTASLLYLTRQNKKHTVFKVTGAGLWHEDDTEALSAMMDPVSLRSNTPLRVSYKEKNISDVNLFNLAEFVDDDSSLDSSPPQFGTTRVIRIYQHIGSKIDLIQRIDWELRKPLEGYAYKYNSESITDSDFATHLNGESIDAVIINDICKGVVSPSLIEWLCAHEGLKKAKWFISTKQWMPEWFDIIDKAEINIELVMMHQVAARSAIRNGDVTQWITRSGQASLEVLDEMDKVAKTFSKKPIIIVMPGGIQVVARHANGKSVKGYVQKDSGSEDLSMQVPIASVFYPALISYFMVEDNLKIHERMQKALDFTKDWMEHEARRVIDPEDWNPANEPNIEITPKKARDAYANKHGEWESFDWNKVKRRWEHAFESFGIISCNGGEKHLELWRPMIEVDGYVCCVKSKRKVIKKLVHELESFKSQHERIHRSCMLIARPGSGKTFLVSRLANSLNMRFLNFNITQMLSKNDILDCFDTIATTQAQNRDETIIVFFDEINAKIAMEPVYDTFLAPIEQGVYLREGKTFHIDPCFWFFAGTEHPTGNQNPLSDKSHKASDFVSRLTLPPLELKMDGAEARIEKVYLGVSVLRSVFPDVRRISEKVLRTFHSLRPNLEVRDVEHFVKSFIDIQYGEVLSKNVNQNWISDNQDSEIDLVDWSQWDEGDMVEIVS